MHFWGLLANAVKMRSKLLILVRFGIHCLNMFLQAGLADILVICRRNEQLIGFVNLCFYKQGLQILLLLFVTEKCVFRTFWCILDP